MLGLPEIEQARERLRAVARVTPLYGSETLSRLVGRPVHLKAENLQRTGSFKVRGAVNKIATLGEDERGSGVVAASAGNHAQAVAWAAREAGIRSTIFVPQDAPMAKVEATRNYGAQVEMGGEAIEDAVEAALGHVAESGATFVHPYEDPFVVAGQGTIGLELAEQLEQPSTVVVPIGGGGLAAGIGLAVRAARPDVRVVGVRATLDAFPIADGIAVKQPGELTSPILAEVLDEVVEVDTEDVAQAIVLLLERTKLVVEGAGAVGIAALLEGKVPGDGPVAVVLSGGNVDASTLITVMRYGLTLSGRHLVARTWVPDRPGELLKLLELVARERVNVLSVEHRREGVNIPVGATGIELTLLTRDDAHCDALLDQIRGWGYDVERVR
ncbi:MAG TPA: pyridoxal-phosphate dependent enzyme [Gaiellaceae bacterium]|nr:pyridoxal-phosphate dependent enzyme [Gaiellaceae bacterium]